MSLIHKIRFSVFLVFWYFATSAMADCIGESPVITGKDYLSDSDVRCVGAASVTMGDSRIRSGASVVVYAPRVRLESPVTIESGANVRLSAISPQKHSPRVVNEGASQSITLPSGSGTYTLGTPANGSLSGTAPNLSYTPEIGFIGQDQFTYVLDDGVNPPTVGVINLDIQQYLASPDMVQLVSASSSVTDRITVNWLPTQDDATPHEQLIYKVHISTEEGFQPAETNVAAQTTGGISALLTGLQADTRYHLMVSATDGDGNQAWSNPISARTIAAPASRTTQAVVEQQESNAPIVTEGSVIYTSTGTVPAVGDVITSEENGGYLRRVTAVNESSGTVTVTTEPATLGEVFNDLDLSTNVTLAPLPATASRMQNRSYRSASGETFTARELEWSKTGFTLIDANPHTLRRRSLTSDLSAQTLQRAQIDIDGQYQTITGEYLRVRAPAYVAAEPGKRRRFDVNVEEAWDRQNYFGSYTHMQLCKIEFHDFSHPDSGLESSASNPAVADYIQGSGNEGYTGYASIGWQPGTAQVDPKGRPYELVLRAYIDEEDENCNGDDAFGTWEEVLDIEIPIYVTKGSAAAKEENQLTFEGTADFSITNEADFSITPEIQVGATIRSGDLKNAEVKVLAPMDFSNVLTVSASGSASVNAEAYLLNPRTFIKVFVAGGVPVVITGEFSIKATMEGNVSGAMQLQKTIEVNIPAEFGLTYDDSRTEKWQVVRKFEPEYRFRIQGDAEATADLTLKLVPDLRISFYDAASARMLAEPYLYAEAGIEGHFVYEQNSGGQMTDLDYWFNTLEAGMGVDLRLYAGLDIFGYNIVGYPRAADGVDDIDNFALFHPLPRTPIIGLPSIHATQHSERHPSDSRAILISGGSEDLPNPFGEGSLNPFKHWSGAKVLSFQTDHSLIPSADPLDGEYWFSYDQPGDYTVRLGGYSKLGWFVRQIAETEITITDSDNDGMADQWEERYGISDPNGDPDGDGLSNLEEYQQRSFPLIREDAQDRDGDGMPDAYEMEHGLDPDDPRDAWYDHDNDGISNLREYLTGGNPSQADTAAGQLNDTGIVACADGSSNGLPCPVADYPNQDAEHGADVSQNHPADGHAGFSFTKLDNSGNPLPDSASSWSCIEDNRTGLIWAVKSNQSDLHGKDDTYTWYDTNALTNGGNLGNQNSSGDTCHGYQAGVASSYCNAEAYIERVNNQGLCGASDWRMPQAMELQGIAALDRTSPAIDHNYFPYTASSNYWTALPISETSGRVVSFQYGGTSSASKGSSYRIRPVRGNFATNLRRADGGYPDSDGDGMPDYFERAFGLNPYATFDAWGDLDGDGFTNLGEYQQGTNPVIANRPSVRQLNDTGITGCADGGSNGLGCGIADYPNQDAEQGGDTTHNDGSDGHAGFSFTKLDDNGYPLPRDAQSWSCVRDNLTGLTWQGKTLQPGPHHRDDTFTWYNTDTSSNGGNPGNQNPSGVSCHGYDAANAASFCNAEAYIQRINALNLCGKSDWRLPQAMELQGIAALDRTSPAVDHTYFPYTASSNYWTALPISETSGRVVSFQYGGTSSASKGSSYRIRLTSGDFATNLRRADGSYRDGDSDGMPDFYELQHGLDPDLAQDALSDKDGDGRNNLSEYRNGTNASIPNRPTGNRLNDTGITACADAGGNDLACGIAAYPNQDAEQGADTTHNDGSDGHAGFSFTKLDNSGNPLPRDAQSWSCVKDNVTGLIWEAKTAPGGLHQAGDTFSWYNTDDQTNGGNQGNDGAGSDSCYGYQSGVSSSYCNTQAFIQRTNSQGLCGASDWRLPNAMELQGLTALDRTSPAVDQQYFPRTASSNYWTAHPISETSGRVVSFQYGSTSSASKGSGYRVRLVRGGR